MGKNNCSDTIVSKPLLGYQSPTEPQTTDETGFKLSEEAPSSSSSVRSEPESQGSHPRDDLRILCSGQWPSRLNQAYLVGLPTTRGLWSRAAEAMPAKVDSLEQEQLCWAALQSTLLHPLALNFPRDVNHDLATLEWLTHTFKAKGWDSETFSRPTQLCKDRIDSGDHPELVYKSYILDASCSENSDKIRDHGTVVESLVNNYLDSDRNDLMEQYKQGLFRNLRVPKESVTKPIFSATPSDVPNKQTTAICSSPSNMCSDRSRDGLPKVSLCGGGHITLLEAVGGIARGTTGLTSWGGGAVMAEWLDNNKQLLQGRRVLELGSGVGYLALAMLESCCSPTTPPPTEQQLQTEATRGEGVTIDNKLNRSTQSQKPSSSIRDGGDSSATQESRPPLLNRPASYTATDCHPHVLDLLFHNLSLMDPSKKWSPSDLRTHQQLVCESLVKDELPAGDAPPSPWSPPSPLPPIRGVQTKVMYLDWRTPDLSIIPSADVIIAADIVYAKHLLRPLAMLLRRLLSRRVEAFTTPKTKTNGVKEEGPVTAPAEAAGTAYIACTRRNNKTLSDFFSYLHEENLAYSLVYQATLDTESALFVYNESHIPVKVYKIVLSSD